MDVYVQSTDKNLLVPVGGSIVAGPDAHTKVADVCKNYPGICARIPFFWSRALSLNRVSGMKSLSWST